MAETKALSMPDTKALDAKTNTLVVNAQAIMIANDETYAVGGDYLQMLRSLKQEIDNTFDDSIRAAHATHKTIIAARDKHRKPVLDAEGIIKNKMGEYHRIQERKLKEEENHLKEMACKEEELDRHQRAEALIEQGRPEEALKLLDEPVEPPPVIMHKTTAPKIKGIQTKEVVKAEVTDLMVLIKAVAAGEAPENLIQANMPAVNKMAQALGKSMKVPGIRVYSDKVIAVGGR
jgi:hypothetical protein